MQPKPNRDPLYPIGSIFQYWGETLTVIAHRWDRLAGEYDCICENGKGESCRVPETFVPNVRIDPNRS